MNITQIEENLQTLIKSINKETFIYDLLLAYGSPKAAISRLKDGNKNLSKEEGEVSWKKKVFFKVVLDDDLQEALSELESNIKQNQRFVMVTDFQTLVAIDTKTQEKLDIELKELPNHFDFFLPWAGMEKAQHINENPADVKAATKMAKLFDEIKKDNPDKSPEFIHSLNVFLSRLLFCYFAEDTNIFKDNQFVNAIDAHTQKDGSDLDTYLDKLFLVLNTPEKDRRSVSEADRSLSGAEMSGAENRSLSGAEMPVAEHRSVSGAELPEYLNSFPYVNGGLFKDKLKVPKFTRRSRQALIDGGDLQWADINPDIFGSMFQAVIDTDQRGSLGQHYTSVPNIMKVIEPLFLNELYETFEAAKGNEKKLNELLVRISKIKIFDPACGSGNFLIIAYKELRRLEMKIFLELEQITKTHKTKHTAISLNNFYGIEIDDFAHEIAQLALWLAVHQMNVEFEKQFGRSTPTLPLTQAGKIVHANACRVDWEEVCPKRVDDEIYILGNPPYLGARMQQEVHKTDMDFVFSSFKNYRDLDYIAIWFYKAANYIKGINSKCAFVSTNSICQGLQVGLIWPHIFELGVEINFAHTAFKWSNNAKKNAGVTVAIIGLGNISKQQKKLFSDGIARQVGGINVYLSDGGKTIIQRRSKPLSNFPDMSFGNMPNDGGGLILSTEEKDKLLSANPEAEKYIKTLLGSQEFIRGQIRYCLWISNEERDKAQSIPYIADCIANTKKHRLESKDKGTNKLANRSYQFRDIKEPKNSQIIMPSVSSERRKYIPTGFLGKDTVISNLGLVVYDGEPWLLGVMTSEMHMVWTKKIGGYLGTSIRYAKDIVYNTFPFPPISDQRKQEITQCVFRILEEREKHPDKTLAQLYDPDKMPDGLREAHHQNDLAIERCYRSKPFESDEERLEYLFKLYEKMIEEEKNKGTLFEKQKLTRKKKK